MFCLFNDESPVLLIYVDMITYKEKDKLVSYIISTGLVDFIIDYKEVFPEKDISENEFFLILSQFVDMGLLSRSKEMTGGVSYIGVTAYLHDLFTHGGFKAREEMLAASLEKLGYELDELSKSNDPKLLERVDKISGIAASISTALGLFAH